MYIIDFKFTDVSQLTEELTAQHRAHLAKEYADGRLIVGGPKSPRTGGIIVSQHQSADELNKLLLSDPIVKAKLATFEITEFTPVLQTESFVAVITPPNAP